MKNLIIVGAGGFGREVLSYCFDIQKNNSDNNWHIIGFIDDNLNALNNYSYDISIIDTIKNYIPSNDDLFVMAIGLPTDQKISIAESLVKRGAQFISLIHPTARVDQRAIIGQGCIIAPYAGISCDTVLGNFVTLNAYSSVGHDSIIEDGCTISSYASIAGKVVLGTGVSVGLHGCVLPGCKIGNFAVIGSGSVVVKNVKANSTVMGVPAKKII